MNDYIVLWNSQHVPNGDQVAAIERCWPGAVVKMQDIRIPDEEVLADICDTADAVITTLPIGMAAKVATLRAGGDGWTRKVHFPQCGKRDINNKFTHGFFVSSDGEVLEKSRGRAESKSLCSQVLDDMLDFK
jgi:hypothetical protein